MIALVMMKMSLIIMSIFVECIGFVSTHQIGKIDFARGIDVCAEKFNIFRAPCELCNERGHLHLQCKLFHDWIVSKNCDN